MYKGNRIRSWICKRNRGIGSVWEIKKQTIRHYDQWRGNKLPCQAHEWGMLTTDKSWRRIMSSILCLFKKTNFSNLKECCVLYCLPQNPNDAGSWSFPLTSTRYISRFIYCISFLLLLKVIVFTLLSHLPSFFISILKRRFFSSLRKNRIIYRLLPEAKINVLES